jgi:integrase
MAWARTIAGKRGTSYIGRYRDRQGITRSAGTFARKKDALQAAQDAESKLRNGGRVGDARLGRLALEVYVWEHWLPSHPIELSTREGYTTSLRLYVLPWFGEMALLDIAPQDVRDWIADLKRRGVRPPTVQKAKTVLDAILSTAFTDEITAVHASHGIKTPPVLRKSKKIMTAADFDALHEAIGSVGDARSADGAGGVDLQLLVETGIETGLRWGELTELRPADYDRRTRIITISRAVVELKAPDRPSGSRFVVKTPKDNDCRDVGVSEQLGTKLEALIDLRGLGERDLLFPLPALPVRRTRPAMLPDPATLGMTDPTPRGSTYPHGTLTAYNLAKCRCRYCRDAAAAYRAERRAAGKDGADRPQPRRFRTRDTDGHISNYWFRK